MNERAMRKIVIIGAGFVGSTTAYTLMISGLSSEMVLIDINKEKCEGEVMDLNHGMSFVSPVKIYAGDYSDCKNADIIIIAAGANQKPGETRIDLAHKNTAIFKNIINNVVRYNNDCILLVVTNPVDILTYVSYKVSGFPKSKVIGSGTVLDTSRLKYLIGEQISIDTRNVHGYIIGEHGDTELPTWSLTNIAGIPMDDYCKSCTSCNNKEQRKGIFENVKNAAYQIIDKKGATYYAVALAVKKIVEAIIRNENSILTVSSFLDNKFGLTDVCLSLPSIVNNKGIGKILDIPLNETEVKLFQKSGNSLKKIINELNL